MANVTVTPGHSGPIEVLVQVEDADEKPLAVDALLVTLSNPDKQIALVTAAAERVAADSWRVRLTVAESGKWPLSLGIELAKNDRVDIAAPILIKGRAVGDERVRTVPRYCVVNSTTAIAIDSPIAHTVSVVDRTPIARNAPAKVMMMGVAVSRPNCASLIGFRPH